MDFSVDGLANGRRNRILSVVDAFTRKCLVLEADTRLGSGRVIQALDRLIVTRPFTTGKSIADECPATEKYKLISRGSVSLASVS